MVALFHRKFCHIDLCQLSHRYYCVILYILPYTQSIAAFEEGSFLPLPSREAVERSIGKGGNGTISVVYFKGLEFAVKRVSGQSMLYRAACDMHVTPVHECLI